MENSPFGRLPAELRDTIYELTLSYNHLIHVGRKSYESYEPRRITANTLYRPSDLKSRKSPDVAKRDESLIALTRTCKLIRHESSPIFFSSNAFHFVHDNETCGLDRFTHFLSAIGSQNTAALRSCTIEIPGIDFPMHLNPPDSMFEDLLVIFRTLQTLGSTVLVKCDVTVVVSFLYYYSKKPLALGVGCRDLCASLSAVIDDYHAQWQSFKRRPSHHRELAIAVDYLRSMRDELEQTATAVK